MSETQSVAVDLIGDHPHAGRRGAITINDDKVQTILVFGTPMVLVEIDRFESCYAGAKHIRKVKP